MTPLLTAKDVADYLRVVPRYVTEKLVLVPTFPRPIRLPAPNGARGRPKWKLEDLEQWVEKYRT